jgi:leucyl-tRNA synthetase
VRLLNPITPHICEALWQALGNDEALHAASWPVADEEARVRLQLTLVIQVNGKVRARLEVEPGLQKDDAVKRALDMENVQRFVKDGSIRKLVYVPDRLLNIVVG